MALKARLEAEYTRREEARAAMVRARVDAADAPAHEVDGSALAVARVFGVTTLSTGDASASLPPRDYTAPANEAALLFARPRAMDSREFDAMKWLGGLPLVQAVAADVLSVPCGEAPCERIFSIAGRVIRGRERLTPARLAQLVFVRKNSDK